MWRRMESDWTESWMLRKKGRAKACYFLNCCNWIIKLLKAGKPVRVRVSAVVGGVDTYFVGAAAVLEKMTI
jgi:hypothetical protein